MAIALHPLPFSCFSYYSFSFSRDVFSQEWSVFCFINAFFSAFTSVLSDGLPFYILSPSSSRPSPPAPLPTNARPLSFSFIIDNISLLRVLKRSCVLCLTASVFYNILQRSYPMSRHSVFYAILQRSPVCAFRYSFSLWYWLFIVSLCFRHPCLRLSHSPLLKNCLIPDFYFFPSFGRTGL